MTREYDKKAYQEELDIIAKREYEKEQLLIVGDCVVKHMNIKKYFSKETIYNNGICCDTTRRLMDSLYKRVIKYKPSKCFLTIGSNDLRENELSVKEIYNNIVTIVKEIKRRSKDTTVYLMTIVPVNPANKDYINRDYVDSIDNFEVNMLNYYLKNFARRNHIKLIDVNKHLKNDFDQLCLDYTTDGFHLNHSGYEIMTSLIKEYV